MRKILALVLCIALCLPLLTPAQAETQALVISTAEEFLTFAENCRLDSYSKGLTVRLTADIDLAGTDFQGIPIFCGSFDAGGHTVSGVNITAGGSDMGFFRYVMEGATVSRLSVNGTITPGGTAANTGGIAGINAGTIQGCTFAGEVTGTDNVGGIAGSNTLSGVIENCKNDSVISANHFAGGIVGKNSGVIRSCVNQGNINTTEKQNKVDISDITIDTLTGTESSLTVTDIGGIAGSSSGVIRSCENKANVGYLHIGYNIGGIAGSQTGFLTECTNYGAVHGRKDTGGIVGHLVPNTTLIFEEDTLQILSAQLEELSALTDQASANADRTTNALSAQLTLLDSQVNDAKDAAIQLLPGTESMPDPDSILAAGNQLNSSLTGIGSTLGNISTQAESGTQAMASDIDAIFRQLEDIEKTLESSEENLNSHITDISDLDTEEDTAAKVSYCVNNGTVNGDRNIGGIVGVIGFENDLDPESDVDVLGQLSLNNACDIRAVIRSCSNAFGVTGKNQNTGGIVGSMALGLVRDCTNTGSVTANTGSNTGGIAGQASGGFIRSCFVKAAITGDSFTGGVAGAAPVVTDCHVMVKLSGQEAAGAILGKADSRDQIAGNHYLPVGTDIGGIDGISYDGCAQPQTLQDFLALQNLPELFKTNTVTFLFADGTQKTLTVPQGSSPEPADIPSIPAQEGAVGAWIGVDGAALDNILFDSVFQVSDTLLPNTLACDALRENGQPILLVQGTFPIGSAFTVESIPADQRMDACIEAWNLSLPEGSVQLRYRLPEGCDPDKVLLRLQDADYNWRDVTFTVDGNYIVASLQNGDRALQLVTAPANYTVFILIVAGILLLGAAVSAVAVTQRKKKKKA